MAEPFRELSRYTDGQESNEGKQKVYVQERRVFAFTRVGVFERWQIRWDSRRGDKVEGGDKGFSVLSQVI